MIRIVMISPSSVLGGAEDVFATLVRLGSGAGLDITPVLLAHGPLEGRLKAMGADPVVIDAGRLRHPRTFMSTVGALRRLMRRVQPDVVVSNMSKAHLYAVPAAALAGRLATIWWQPSVPVARNWMDRTASALPAKLVLASSTAVATAQRKLPLSPPVRVVYPGTDVSRFSPKVEPRPRRALGWDDNLVVGLPGRLHPEKRQDLFLLAARRVADEFPRARFVLIGGAILGWEGGYLEALQRLVQELQLSGVVHFAGHVDNVPEWLASCDIVVNTTAPEGFGLTVTEAMATGRPVVAFAMGGPAETIQDGVSGMLVADLTPEAVASAICQLAADPQARQQMGAAARQRVADEFSVERCVERFAEALRAALAAP